MLRIGFVGWRGMVGSVLMGRMKDEQDFKGFEPIFFTTSNIGGEGPAVGLAIPLRRAPVQDPKRYHDYVSGDTSVSVLGTALPSTQLDPDPERALPMIWQSVAGLTRSTARALRRRGPARSLFLLAARALTDASTGRIGEFAGVSRRSVTRVPVGRTPALRVVEQVVGDQRLRPVDAVDLCGLLRRRRWVQASPSRPGPRRTSSHWGVGPG